MNNIKTFMPLLLGLVSTLHAASSPPADIFGHAGSAEAFPLAVELSPQDHALRYLHVINGIPDDKTDLLYEKSFFQHSDAIRDCLQNPSLQHPEYAAAFVETLASKTRRKTPMALAEGVFQFGHLKLVQTILANPHFNNRLLVYREAIMHLHFDSASHYMLGLELSAKSGRLDVLDHILKLTSFVDEHLDQDKEKIYYTGGPGKPEFDQYDIHWAIEKAAMNNHVEMIEALFNLLPKAKDKKYAINRMISDAIKSKNISLYAFYLRSPFFKESLHGCDGLSRTIAYRVLDIAFYDPRYIDILLSITTKDNMPKLLKSLFGAVGQWLSIELLDHLIEHFGGLEKIQYVTDESMLGAMRCIMTQRNCHRFKDPFFISLIERNIGAFMEELDDWVDDVKFFPEELYAIEAVRKHPKTAELIRGTNLEPEAMHQE